MRAKTAHIYASWALLRHNCGKLWERWLCGWAVFEDSNALQENPEHFIPVDAVPKTAKSTAF